MIQVPRHPFAQREIHTVGVVDEESERLRPRSLERDQLDLSVELVKLLLDVVLEVFHVFCGEKKVGQAHFSRLLGTKKLKFSIARSSRPAAAVCRRGRGSHRRSS